MQPQNVSSIFYSYWNQHRPESHGPQESIDLFIAIARYMTTVLHAVSVHLLALIGIKLYCLVTEAHVYQQVAKSHYMKWNSRETLNLCPFDYKSNTSNNYNIMPQ